MTDPRIRLAPRYEPVDPNDPDHVAAADEANAKLAAEIARCEAWKEALKARLEADKHLPKVHLPTRTGRVEAIVRLDGDRLFTRLAGQRTEVPWTLDVAGDVWRCERYNGLTLNRREVERNTTGARVQGALWVARMMTLAPRRLSAGEGERCAKT